MKNAEPPLVCAVENLQKGTATNLVAHTSIAKLRNIIFPFRENDPEALLSSEVRKKNNESYKSCMIKARYEQYTARISERNKFCAFSRSVEKRAMLKLAQTSANCMMDPVCKLCQETKLVLDTDNGMFVISKNILQPFEQLYLCWFSEKLRMFSKCSFIASESIRKSCSELAVKKCWEIRSS